MKASEALSIRTVLYLLQLGADPFVQDSKGRTARRYVEKIEFHGKGLDQKHEVFKILLRAEQK